MLHIICDGNHYRPSIRFNRSKGAKNLRKVPFLCKMKDSLYVRRAFTETMKIGDSRNNVIGESAMRPWRISWECNTVVMIIKVLLSAIPDAT